MCVCICLYKINKIYNIYKIHRIYKSACRTIGEFIVGSLVYLKSTGVRFNRVRCRADDRLRYSTASSLATALPTPRHRFITKYRHSPPPPLRRGFLTVLMTGTPAFFAEPRTAVEAALGLAVERRRGFLSRRVLRFFCGGRDPGGDVNLNPLVRT